MAKRTRATSRARRGGPRRPHPVLLASRPGTSDAETSALVDLLDDALAHGTEGITIDADGRAVTLTNLTKRYFPLGGPGAQCKGDLLRYYLAVAPVILPHLAERPVVLTRYPDGVGGKGFYVQRAPEQRPSWVATCTTSIKPPKELTYLRVENVATLAWVANLGAIELHPWYARCSAPTKPDFLVVDLDPTEGTRFDKVRSAALHVKEALDTWGLPSFIKTSGATGLHLYVPIERGPTQREVHGVARDLAMAIASRYPRVFTTEYRIANRPRGTVLLDFNQNSAGPHARRQLLRSPDVLGHGVDADRLERAARRSGAARFHAGHRTDASIAARRSMDARRAGPRESGSAGVEGRSARREAGVLKREGPPTNVSGPSLVSPLRRSP